MTVAVTASGSTREIPHSRPEPEHLSAAPPGPPRASSSVTQPPAATASTKQPARRRPRAGGSVSQHSVKLMPGYVAKSAACTDTRGCTRGCTIRVPSALPDEAKIRPHPRRKCRFEFHPSRDAPCCPHTLQRTAHRGPVGTSSVALPPEHIGLTYPGPRLPDSELPSCQALVTILPAGLAHVSWGLVLTAPSPSSYILTLTSSRPAVPGHD